MILQKSRTAALRIIAAIVTAATLTAFCESYRGLWLWSSRHGVPGGWALAWPAMVDVFVAVGELSLFVAVLDRWPARTKAFPWLVTLAGLAVSVAGNAWHAPTADLASRGTAAVPPIAAAAALAVGLSTLKRVASQHADAIAAKTQTRKPSDAAVPAPPALDPAALADAPSDAARVRLAASIMGTRSVAGLMPVLRAAGYPVAREAARSALRKRPRQSGRVVRLAASRDYAGQEGRASVS